MSVYTRWIPAAEGLVKGLGRHVEHDAASLEFKWEHRGDKPPQKDNVWAHSTPVLDQGQKSSCTGNAAAQLLNCDLYKPNRVARDKTWLTEADALNFYHLATHDDGFGPDNYYPPNDDGSSGLGVAKALEDTGWISRYEHCFSLTDACTALATQPVIVGTNWTQDMFTPDGQGYVHPTGETAGGHEYLLRGVLYSTQTLVFLNSWGANWGPMRGTFLMSFADFESLLGDQGDVVVPIVKTA